jgi:ribosomal protein S12 methylthiotransferase accessory factor
VIPVERELSLRDAELTARAEVAALGWRVRLERLSAGEPTAVRATLAGADGAPVPGGAGAGKGDARSAVVGALFESLEHAFTGPAAARGWALRTVPVERVAAGPLAADAAITELASTAATRLACLPHTSARDGGPVDVPLFLWAPWSTGPDRAEWRRSVGDDTDYGRVKSYSVNTGCAIGATEDEAVLHALGECVERDALSLFLLRCVHDRARPPRRLARALLSGDLVDLLLAAEEVIGGELELFDLTTDLDVPVVLALTRHAPGPAVGRHGVGASSSPAHAVRRAVTELVQAVLVARRSDLLRHEAAVTRALGRHPELLACARLELPGTAVDTADTAARFTRDTGLPAVAEQRRQLTGRLLDAGHDVLISRLATLPHGTTAVHAHCPGLERFHLVLGGHVALPGPRAGRLRRSGG